MLYLGARVSLVPAHGTRAYGATVCTAYDRTGREVRRELRGRDQELLDIATFVELDEGKRVAGRPGQTTLATRLPWNPDHVRSEVQRMVYDDNDCQPRWLELMVALTDRNVAADDAALAALPYVVEFDDPVIARYES